MSTAWEHERPWLRGHMPALDGIRGLAILSVTIFRFAGEGPTDESFFGKIFFKFAGQGFRGVDLFFVLSGFLITGILYDAKGSSRYFRNFYIRRSLRIFPLYYGVLSVVLLGGWLAPAFFRQFGFGQAIDHPAWLWLYGTNVFQAHHAEYSFGPLKHFWSLAVEEHFYLVWPIVIASLDRRQAMKACIFFIGFALSIRLYVVQTFTPQAEGVITEVFTLCRLDALSLGAFLALWLRGPASTRSIAVTLASITFVTYVTLVPTFINAKRFLTLPHTLIPLACMGLILWAVSAPSSTIAGRVFSSPFLRTLGKYSYGMYVFQNPLIYFCPKSLAPESLSQTLDSVFFGKCVYILGMSLTTFFIAWLSWHAYEKWFLKLKDSFPDKRS